MNRLNCSGATDYKPKVSQADSYSYSTPNLALCMGQSQDPHGAISVLIVQNVSVIAGVGLLRLNLDCNRIFNCSL